MKSDVSPRLPPGQINTLETAEPWPNPTPAPCRHCRSPPRALSSAGGSVVCACASAWHWIDCWWLRSWQSQGQERGLVVIRWSWVPSGDQARHHPPSSHQWPVTGPAEDSEQIGKHRHDDCYKNRLVICFVTPGWLRWWIARVLSKSHW